MIIWRPVTKTSGARNRFVRFPIVIVAFELMTKTRHRSSTNTFTSSIATPKSFAFKNYSYRREVYVMCVLHAFALCRHCFPYIPPRPTAIGRQTRRTLYIGQRFRILWTLICYWRAKQVAWCSGVSKIFFFGGGGEESSRK